MNLYNHSSSCKKTKLKNKTRVENKYFWSDSTIKNSDQDYLSPVNKK
jgi:hypothetical protein